MLMGGIPLVPESLAVHVPAPVRVGLVRVGPVRVGQVRAASRGGGVVLGPVGGVPVLVAHAPSIADMSTDAAASGAPVVVRDATPGDIPAMAAIYDEQVRTSVATFDTQPRGAAYLGEKVAAASAGNVVLVAEEGERLLGYAFSGAFRPRPAYDGTKEVSVYLAAGARGRGLGRTLYAALLARLDAVPQVHTQVAVIALPNDASEALHRAFGFERVGVLREVGYKFGRFVDTAWYQRMSPAD
jgi:L-amino acid N-acyltransferase YncA